MLLDSHCHLTHRLFQEEGISATQLVEEAQQAKVEAMMLICCRMRNEFHEDILPTAIAHDAVWCTVGTHPHEASNPDEMAFTADQIVALTRHDKVVGIGECGLDYFYDFAKKQDQKQVFRTHIEACLDAQLPIIIHSRDAEDDTINIIRDVDPGRALTGIMHCFSSSAALAEQSLEHGLHISFSGMITFKKNDALREIAKNTPLDRILAETDAPYLAPVPYRGKTNRPAYVQHTVQCLAEIHDTTFKEMAQITRDNYFNLFKKAVRP